MPIRVQCQSCKKTLQVPDSAEGKKAKCPSCQTLVKVERHKPIVSVAAEFPKPLTQPASVPSSALNTHDRIEVKCHGCGKRLRVPSTAVGKAVRCPECKESILIPLTEASSVQIVPLQNQVASPALTVVQGIPTGPSTVSSSPFGENSLWEEQPFPSGGTFGGKSSQINPYTAPVAYGNYTTGGSSRSRSTQYKVIGVCMMFLGVLFVFSTVVRIATVTLGLYLIGSKLDLETTGDVIMRLTISTTVGLLLGIGFLQGGLAFTRQSNLNGAKCGAALMAIPCFGLCFFPIGIWASILAFGERIKKDFD